MHASPVCALNFWNLPTLVLIKSNHSLRAIRLYRVVNVPRSCVARQRAGSVFMITHRRSYLCCSRPYEIPHANIQIAISSQARQRPLPTVGWTEAKETPSKNEVCSRRETAQKACTSKSAVKGDSEKQRNSRIQPDMCDKRASSHSNFRIHSFKVHVAAVNGMDATAYRTAVPLAG